MLTVLHCSDFHFGNRSFEKMFTDLLNGMLPPRIRRDERSFVHDSDVYDAFIQVLKMDTTFDVLVVSGDICETGEQENVAEAFKRIQEIEHAAGKPVFLIPGNHDWFTDRVGTHGRSAFAHEFNSYWNFGDIKRLFNLNNISIVGLDCSPVHYDATKWPEDIGIGYVSDEIIEQISSIDADKQLWTVHYAPIDDADIDIFLRLDGAYEFYKKAQSCNVFAILFGHIHEKRVYGRSYPPAIGCGTTTAFQKAGKPPNHFQKIVFDDSLKLVRIHHFEYDRICADFEEKVELF